MIVPVAFGLLPRQGRFFLQRRAPDASWCPGLWEFPGGKLEGGEAPEAALRRELREEIGWSPARVAALPVFRHAYPGRLVELHPFLCEGEGTPATTLAWGWFTPAELLGLAMPEANGKLIRRLLKKGTIGM